MPPESLTKKNGKYTFPIGKACLPTIIFRGHVKLRGCITEVDARAVSLLLRSRANVHAIGDSVKDAEMWPVWVGWKYWTWCVWWVSNILTDVKLSKKPVVRMLLKKNVAWRSQFNSAGLHKSQTSYGLFEPVNLSAWLSRSTTLSDTGPCRCVHFVNNTWIVLRNDSANTASNLAITFRDELHQITY